MAAGWGAHTARDKAFIYCLTVDGSLKAIRGNMGREAEKTKETQKVSNAPGLTVMKRTGME